MGGGPVAPEDLEDFLTHSLFKLLVKTRLPYPKADPIDCVEFGRSIFVEDNFSHLVKDKVWPVLLALSKFGLNDMPDLSRYLPEPSDSSFPEQCLGLQLLLDFCPRILFSGVDSRWTYAYFDIVSQRLARMWRALPVSQQPGSWVRWQKDTGLDYWVAVRFWLGTPFAHSEAILDQEIALAFTEETRSAIEKASGQVDPHRIEREDILSDIYGFPRLYRAGPPGGKGVTRESWTFWMGMLMDIHKPIVDLYGRYPYLDAIQGRESPVEEKKWIEEIGHFEEAPEDIARLIREDVKLGQWRPLGEGSHTKATG